MGALRINELLVQELESRKRVNQKYSLRQFAEDIQVSVAQLSKVISGKSTLSEKKLYKVARLLNWPQEQFQRAMAQSINTQGRRELAILKKQSQRYKLESINEEKFKLISEWYHLALLELMHTKNFNNSVEAISQRLGVDPIKITEAIERLVELKFIKIKEDGSWEDISRFSTTLDSFDTSAAMKLYQNVILQKAQWALENIDVSQRSQTAVTFVVSKNKIKEAREKVIAFQRALVASLQEGPDEQEDVFQLSISLFPLTLNDKKDLK